MLRRMHSTRLPMPPDHPARAGVFSGGSGSYAVTVVEIHNRRRYLLASAHVPNHADALTLACGLVDIFRATAPQRHGAK